MSEEKIRLGEKVKVKLYRGGRRKNRKKIIVAIITVLVGLTLILLKFL
ncbi:MAG: hypothetical protein ACPL3B_08525 [Fervidobacterium sp.]